jgi:sulfoxide reductase heme-binding subunit YedZ
MRWAKAMLFVAALAPFVSLAWRTLQNDLGTNPLETLQHSTGDWTLRFLVISLAVTPARKIFSFPALIRFRRMLGLFAFFYGCLHLLTYVWLDKFFTLDEISKDIVKRPFITMGFASWVLMVPLALTSTSGWIRRLGGKRWQMLHRLVYVSAAAGVIHYYWLVKADVRDPVMYGAILALLLLWRVKARWDDRRAAVRQASARASA